MGVDFLTAGYDGHCGRTSDACGSENAPHTFAGGNAFAGGEGSLPDGHAAFRISEYGRRSFDCIAKRYCAQGCFQLAKRFDAVFRGKHHYAEIRVGKFTGDIQRKKKRGKFGPRVTEGFGGDGQLQLFVSAQREAMVCKPVLHCLHLGREYSEQFPADAVHVSIAHVQRLQDQIGGAGGTEECQRLLCYLREDCRCGGGDVQVCSACENRQGFVRGIAADVRPEINGVAGFRQESQISAVGVVHQKQTSMGMTDPGEGLNIRRIAEVIRAGNVNGGACLFSKKFVQRFRPDFAGKIGRTLFRINPVNIQVKQRSGADEVKPKNHTFLKVLAVILCICIVAEIVVICIKYMAPDSAAAIKLQDIFNSIYGAISSLIG